MQGVDIFDQLMGYYNICRRTIKWTSKFLFYILQLGIENSYVLYTKFTDIYPPKKLSHKLFMLEVANQLINFNDADWPSNPEFVIPRAPPLDPEMRFQSPRKAAHPTTASPPWFCVITPSPSPVNRAVGSPEPPASEPAASS